MIQKLSILTLIFYTGFSTSKEIKFLPHMVSHLHEGCPENSDCDLSYGSKRKTFNQSLPIKGSRTKFFEKHGAPFRFFISSENIKTPKSFAKWDSHCNHLRKKEKPILEVETFIKNLPTKTPTSIHHDSLAIIPKDLYLLRNKNLKKYSIPLNGDLTKIKKDRVIFVVREKSGFYNYSVNSSGELKISNDTKEDRFVSTKCPEQLEKHFKAKQSRVFKTYYCKQDSKGHTVLFSKACI